MIDWSTLPIGIHMRRPFAVLTFAAALASSATMAEPVTYMVLESSTAYFSYNHLELSTQVHQFNRTTGTVMLNTAAKAGSVDVAIDMKSVDTGSAILNDHIQSEELLNTEKFPTATFKSTKIHFNGDKPSGIDGDLTIKGVTRPVTLKIVRFVSRQEPKKFVVGTMEPMRAVNADATVTIKRSDFGAGKYAPAVGDEVRITVSLEAVKPGRKSL